MDCSLRWLASLSTSCLHAAEAACRGRVLADTRMAAAISEPAEGLYREMRTANLPVQRFWRHLVALASGIENNRELAELALDKTRGRDATNPTVAARLAGWIADLESSVTRDLPRLVDELALRGGPLREQWEARGPGLLRVMVELTEPRLLVPRADVVLVHPALGGGGRAHLRYNSLRMEAVLANPVPHLPEIVRLGWLLGQLNVDLPEFSDHVHGERQSLIAELALLPVTLKAAEHVELCRCDRATIELALRSWDVATPLDVDPVEVLDQWWDTFLDTRPNWGVALAALDRMLGGPN